MKEAEITNEKSADLVDYPTVDEYLNPEYIIDFELLIKSLKPLEQYFPDSCFVDAWVKESDKNKNGMFSPYIYKKELSELILNIANAFRLTANQNDTDENLYVAWSRKAADMGNANGILNLIKYIIGFDLDDELLDFWSRRAFALLHQQVKESTNQVAFDESIQLSHHLICLIIERLPSYALDSALKLQINIDRSSHHIDTNHINDTIKSLIEKEPGVLVIESITPSEDRVVRSTLTRYEPLTQALTPLAPIITDIPLIKSTLDDKFPWLAVLTEKIIKMLMVRQLGRGDFYLPPFMLLGPAGIGKTYYVQTLCELINVPFRTISMSGKSDNRDLVGTARGWTGGHPSMPITLIQEHQIANPIIVLDELDKCGGSDQNGRALDSLLTLFETTTSKRVYDEYLCGNLDLSHITWISTGNEAKNLPAALLNRLEVITIDKPEKAHYPQIINDSMKSFCISNGIHLSHIPTINELDRKWFEKYYTSPRVAKRAAEHWLTNRLLNSNESELN